MTESTVSQQFFERHPIELRDTDGAPLAYFASFKCAAFSAVLKGTQGVRTGFTAVDRNTGEAWSFQKCLNEYSDAITKMKPRQHH